MSTRGDTGASPSPGTFKRQRDREAVDRRQEQRVEDVLAHTHQLVHAIAGINSNYVLTLNGERASLSRRVEELQTQNSFHQEKYAEATTQVVQSKLRALQGRVSDSVKDKLITSLRTQVDHGQAVVYESVAAHVNGALQDSLSVTDAQLSAERRLNRELVAQLSTYAESLLENSKAASHRAFEAEADAARKDVLIAKLQATHVVEENMLVRHEEEVDALMRVVAQLAEKSRFAESASTELQRTKKHVRWLEQYLDLNGIVAAVMPESALQTPAASSTANDTASSPPPPPVASLKTSAPHYFALKMLEHKEVTLTELVDNWQAQETRIREAEQKYKLLSNVVQEVQRDALVVHQKYLEEKQRREMADRRITDMVRERLCSQRDTAVADEVQRLRWAYTEVVDDAAQLAVNLKVSRDELRASVEQVTKLTNQVQQLKREAETDQVALTIHELRDEYLTRVRGLEDALSRTQLQLKLTEQISTRYNAVATEATTALQQISHTTAEMTDMPPQVVVQEDPWRSSAWKQEVQQASRQADELLQATAALREYGVEHGELYESQVTELMRQWKLVRAEAEEMERADKSHDGDTAQGVHGDSSLSGSRTLVSSTLSDASFTKLDSVLHSSKSALREALILLVSSLQSTDVERTNLLDASLSDAQCATELVNDVRRITSERDRLKAHLKVCQDLLEKNHVTVVERALMHDVPVEDSLNVAEARERIEVLREQLSAAKQLCDRSLSETRLVTSEKEAAELQWTELSRAHEVLQTHATRLAERLKESLAQEASLMEKNVTLQHQLADLVQSSQAAVGTSEADHSSSSSADAPSRLTALFATLQHTLQNVDTEVQTLHQLRETSGARGDELAGAHGAHGATPPPSGDEHHGSSDVQLGDAALLESLSRSGMMSIIDALKDTLHAAGILKTSLKSAGDAQAAAVCAAAAHTEGSLGSGPSVVPAPSAEVQRRASDHVAAQLEAQLAQSAAERQQLQERLQLAERKTGEMEAANQRLLALSKSILEKQNALKAENQQLKEHVRLLTPLEPVVPTVVAPAEPSPALAAAPAAAAATPPMSEPPRLTEESFAAPHAEASEAHPASSSTAEANASDAAPPAAAPLELSSEKEAVDVGEEPAPVHTATIPDAEVEHSEDAMVIAFETEGEPEGEGEQPATAERSAVHAAAAQNASAEVKEHPPES